MVVRLGRVHLAIAGLVLFDLPLVPGMYLVFLWLGYSFLFLGLTIRPVLGFFGLLGMYQGLM